MTKTKTATAAKKPAKKNNAENAIETRGEYRSRILDMVCDVTACTNQGLDRICKAFLKDQDFPDETSIRRWLREDEELAKRYARAKEDQIEKLVEEIIEISDDDSLDIAFTEDGKQYIDQQHIQRSRLRVDSRKWIASKLKPKKYGDKIDHTIGNPDGTPLDLSVNFVAVDRG